MSCWPSAPNIQSKVLALSSAIQHAVIGQIQFHPQLSISIYRTANFVSALCIGWFQEEFQCPVVSIVEADPLKWDVEGIATEIHFRMQFSLQLRQLP